MERNKLDKAIFLNLILGLLAALTVTFFLQEGRTVGMENIAMDLFFNLRRSIPQKANIIIVEVTDNDITNIGRWAWPRKWHAVMAKALSDMGSRIIYFDLLFSEPSNEQDDAIFEDALKQIPKVYLPFAFQDTPPDINRALFPLKNFLPYLKGIGSINVYADSDGNIRRIIPAFSSGGTLYSHLITKIALDYLGYSIKDMKSDRLIAGNTKEELSIPLDYNYNMIINWVGKWQYTFKHYSFLDVLAKYREFLASKEKPKDLDVFKDSICLVGIACTGIGDIGRTPLEKQYFQVGIIATGIDNIINRSFVRVQPKWVNIIITFAMALLPALLIRGKKPLIENLALFILGPLYFIAAFLVFKSSGILISVFTPLISLFSSSILIEIYHFIRVVTERQGFFKMAIVDGLTGVYNVRHFKTLLQTEIMLAKNDPMMKIALVMMDIDHFKHFNDTYGHQAGDFILKEISSFLKNSVRSSDIVARYGGEEMIIMLMGADLKIAISIAEKLREGIEKYKFTYGKNMLSVTASFGVAVLKDSDSMDSLIERADKGLYKSKEWGRNKVSSEE